MPSSDWLAWLATVSTEDRTALAEKARATNEPTFEALSDLTTEMMAALLEGKISPDVSRELRSWTELRMATVAASRATTTKGSQVTLVGLLTDTDFESVPLEPTYTRRERIIEGELIEEEAEEVAAVAELKS